MRLRNTIVVLVIAAALGAYIFFFERKQPTTEQRQEGAKKLFDFKADDAGRLLIERKGETILCVKEGGEWLLKKPVEMKAEKSEVESILSRLEWAEVERRLEPEKGKETMLDEYGLKEPRLKLSFWVKEAQHELNVGSDAAAGANMYVMTGDRPEVLLIGKSIFDVLSKPLKDLRDKTVIDVEKYSVDKLELEKPPQNIAMVKKEGKWRVESPVPARGSTEEVEKLLDKLKELKVEEFVIDGPHKAAEYGLEKPVLSVTVWQEGASRAVEFGAKVKEKDQIYCQRRGIDSVYAVKKTILDDLDDRLDDLRDKKLVRVESRDDLRRVEIKGAGGRLILAHAGEDWEIQEPIKARADSRSAEDLVGKLEGIEVEKFAAESADAKALKQYGLDQPVLAVTLAEAEPAKEEKPAGEQEKPEEAKGKERVTEVIFGKKVKESCYAKRSDEPALVLVKADILDLGRANAQDYRNRQLFKFERDEVKEVTIERGGKRQVVRRKDKEEWEVLEPKGPEADKSVIDDILWELYDLRAEKLVEELSAPSRKKYGLEKPALDASVTVGEGDKKKVLRLSLGSNTDKNTAYGFAEGGEVEQYVVEVGRNTVEALGKDIAKLKKEEGKTEGKEGEKGETSTTG